MSRLAGVAAAVVLLAACGTRLEEKNVTPQTMAGTAIPPVDREVPATLETATFAVG
jgi:outer membrane lipopolysaccharide assembly protein LptE/RlpB